LYQPEGKFGFGKIAEYCDAITAFGEHLYPSIVGYGKNLPGDSFNAGKGKENFSPFALIFAHLEYSTWVVVMNLFDAIDFADHEEVCHFHDRASGLRAIIAIHSTRLGPAVGGCRMWNYVDEEAAIADALRLSQGMTWKSAMADLPLGGGKSVIWGDPGSMKSPALFRAFGRAVETLKGRYYTGEDVGTTPADMAMAARETRFVMGREEAGSSGDPSPFTADGVAMAMEAAALHKFGATDLRGLRIAVQGLGNVGMALAERLYRRGAKLVVADIDAARVARAVETLRATPVGVDRILSIECDILAPCALGAVINDETVDSLRCRIVAGSANNQLHRPEHGDRLHQRGILYVPDFVANAGGLINIAQEVLSPAYDAGRTRTHLSIIPRRLKQVFERAAATATGTHRVADRMAHEIVEGRRVAA